MIRHFGNITLFGGSHVAEESVVSLRRLFSNNSFDVVALELDSNRFNSLIARMDNLDVSKSYYSPSKIGFQGFLFARIASFIQSELAFRLGVQPGVEMEEAVKFARNHNLRIALVDVPIEETLRRFSSDIPLSEKLKLLTDPLLSVFNRKNYRSFDLSTIPSEELVDEAISLIKHRYPHLFEVFIDSRNKFIASRVFEFYNSGDNVLVVLGAGHIKGVIHYLHKLRKSRSSLPSYNFSFSVSFKN